MRGRFSERHTFPTLIFSQRERNEYRPFLKISDLPDLYVQERTEAVFGVLA